MNEWTVVRIKGARGVPSLDAVQFLGCVAAIRESFADARWHFQWILQNRRSEYDGLRVELPHGTKARKEIVAQFEARVPPPDTVVSEPLRPEIDLDPIQTEAELDFCLDLLWRYSELILDLRTRNPGAQPRQIQGLTRGPCSRSSPATAGTSSVPSNPAASASSPQFRSASSCHW